MKPVYFLIFFLYLLPATVFAQTVDTTMVKDSTAKDSIGTDSLKKSLAADTAKALDSAKLTAGQNFRIINKLLNADAIPVSLAVQAKRQDSAGSFFYLLTAMVLLLALLRYFYGRYFSNLFRVFFNTSLRQNQITDQLLQAKLPSFLFNIFFVISAGIYAFIFLSYQKHISTDNKWLAVLLSVMLIGVVYFVKFCTLKFTAWITGFEAEVNTYVFVIFLINKVIGIFLVPFAVVLAFSAPGIAATAAMISVLCIGFFLLFRFFRSYALIQNQLKISKFHFLLYIAGLEILPLLLIYKGLMIYLSKNL